MTAPATELSKKERLEMFKSLAFVEIISAENERYTEEVKQEVIRRRHEQPGDWEFILDPIGEDKYKHLKIFTA